MRVGIPTEIKNNEYRVAITPAGVAELVRRGHEVLIQAGAGDGSAISDDDFKRRRRADHRHRRRGVGRGRPAAQGQGTDRGRVRRMRKGQTLFTYLHLAASKPCTDALLASGTTSIAYETVQTADGRRLPLLAPMSEVAGRLSAQVGAYHLMRSHGGRGVLMGGVPGVAPAKVVVIGGGMAGDNAAARRRGHGRPRHRLRRQHQHAAQDRRRVRRRHRDPLLIDAGARGRGQAGRPGHRRGAGPRRQGAQAGHQFDCRAHEVGRGAGRHRDRPGRLLRGLAAHHPRRPDLRRARHASSTAWPTCPARCRARRPSR